MPVEQESAYLVHLLQSYVELRSKKEGQRMGSLKYYYLQKMKHHLSLMA